SRRRRVGEDSLRSAERKRGLRVRPQLREVRAVAAANRGFRIATRIPAEAEARREIVFAVAEGLPVVAEAEIERQVMSHPEAVLSEGCVNPLRERVCPLAEVEALLVTRHVGE